MISPRVEHRVDGRRAYTLAEASDVLHVAIATLRQRVHRGRIEPAAHVDGRTPLYYAADLGIDGAMVGLPRT